MNKRWMRVALVSGVLAIGAAACGSSDPSDPVETGSADPAPTGGELPPAPGDSGDSPNVAGACLEGEPDCLDNPAIEQPTDLPAPPLAEEEVSGDQGGFVIGGGLSVAEALATSATGTLAIEGHLYDDGTGPRLCESLEPGGERFQCGGASLAIENFDDELVGAPLVFHEGVTYTEDTMTLFGDLADGVLTLELVAG